MKSKLVIMALVSVIACGCSHITQIGKIGDKKLYKVQATSLLGPTVVSIAIKDGDDLQFLQAFAGNGIVPATISGGALVGGSFLFGHSLRPNQTQVTQQGGGASSSSGSTSGSTSTSGSKSVSGSTSTANTSVNQHQNQHQNQAQDQKQSESEKNHFRFNHHDD